MLKKAIPLFLMSGLVLGACGTNNNGASPNNNETPMENVEDRARDWTPNVRDERRGGTNLDGIDNNQNGNGVRDGVINDGDTTIPDGVINDENQNMPNGPIIENDLNGNDRNINNR